MKPDLESLYSQLDLRPDCSLEEFQRAYRRRIGELHPDRNQGAPQSAETRRQLRQLLWMNATVSRFHRRYGRMPGAMPDFRHRHSHVPELGSRANSPMGSYGSGSDESQGPGRSTWVLMLLLVGLVVLGACWNWLAADPKASAHIHMDTLPGVSAPQVLSSRIQHDGSRDGRSQRFEPTV